MSQQFDVVVVGSCTVDILVRPFSLDEPLGHHRLLGVDRIEATTGGIVSNSGAALARLGLRTAAFSLVGADEWADIVRRKFQAEGIDTCRLLTHPSLPTSTTIVLIDGQGERSFAHMQGAPKQIRRETLLDHLDLFAASRFMLIGYYSLMPNLESDLPDVLQRIRETGCRTAMDTAGTGGGMQPLDRLLPHLDVYVPSRHEATNQTGQSDPRAILDTYRRAGATGLIGVKLGADGALLSPSAGEFLYTPPVPPPGSVIDTTGAGDAFFAGLLAGLLRGLSVEQAGRLAAAAGACCVTGLGASAGLRDYRETSRLAGLAES